MTEKPQAPDTTSPRLSDWERLAHHRGPNLMHWMLVSVVGAGVMLYATPVVGSTSVLIPVAAVLLSPLIFLLGWTAGMSTFSISCQHYRRTHHTWSLIYLLPVLLAATVGLGFLSGRYWWIFSFALALLGHRKGTQRAWWGAVACLAFVFRDPGVGFPPVAHSDEDALTRAIEAVNEEVGRRPSRRDT